MTTKLTRIEVIDWTKDARFGGGRVFQAWEKDIAIGVDEQDEGRTLKVFINDRPLPEPYQ